MKKANVYIVIVAALCLLGAGFIMVKARLGGEREVYTGKDASRGITVTAGAAFVIELAENPSTGFTWHYSIGDEAVVTFISDQFTADGQKNVVGAPGLRQYNFRAAAKGNTILVFEYYQDWVPDHVAEQYEFAVKVK